MIVIGKGRCDITRKLSGEANVDRVHFTVITKHVNIFKLLQCNLAARVVFPNLSHFRFFAYNTVIFPPPPANSLLIRHFVD